jgi:hypothetical protein|tara:strand:- start:273 stop:428 length:156 start_codon:yes stop_codon:yes gene_type:complete
LGQVKLSDIRYLGRHFAGGCVYLFVGRIKFKQFEAGRRKLSDKSVKALNKR